MNNSIIQSDMSQKQNKLQFLKELLRSAGKTYKEIAELSNNEVTQIPYILRKDDCKLSEVHLICEALGYKIEMKLVDDTGKYFIKEKARQREGQHKLDFIYNTLYQIGVTQKDLAYKIDRHGNTLIYNFEVDDMSMSRIYEIAHILDLRLDIYLEYVSPEINEESTGCRVSTTISKTIHQCIDND